MIWELPHRNVGIFGFAVVKICLALVILIFYIFLLYIVLSIIYSESLVSNRCHKSTNGSCRYSSVGQAFVGVTCWMLCQLHNIFIWYFIINYILCYNRGYVMFLSTKLKITAKWILKIIYRHIGLSADNFWEISVSATKNGIGRALFSTPYSHSIIQLTPAYWLVENWTEYRGYMYKRKEQVWQPVRNLNVLEKDNK